MDGAPATEALLYGGERSTPGDDFLSERTEPSEEERGGTAPSVEDLLALHGKPVLDYTALCTAPSPGAAERLAGQALRSTHEAMASHADADFPWRPRLLAAVLEAAREWSTDDRRSFLHPDLRDGRTRDARRSAPGTYGGRGDRGLVLYAFRNLPDRTQTLLWHTEVEGEDVGAVAFLLGVEPSLLNTERARTLLRDECVRAHLDFAPDESCRRLNRLIDVRSRQGSGETIAEVREHLKACAYCGAAADQLDQFPNRLPALLAEAVLGFRAADYLMTRPARRARASARTRSGPAPEHAGAEGRPTDAGEEAPRARRRWPLLAAMGVVLCGVIAAAPMALSGADDDSQGAAGPAPSPSDSVPGSSTAPRSPSASTAPGVNEPLVTRLRNVRTGLCLDVAAAQEAVGALAVTAECVGSATQLWWLEDRGRLRNQAAPGLCLNAEPAGSLALRPCADPESRDDRDDRDDEDDGDTRYDLAADGLLTIATNPGLAVTPVRRAEGAVILLKPVPKDRIRRSQRWRTDEPSTPAPSPSRTRDTTAAE
ncbi:hydrolase [Streptomyces ipomoeae]|uniref:Ricin-type beta-trefoil lectin domain protein n=2 Tax=Streptomyces ipomoeae TaxID=103232 RepID=L1KPU7_9ACTN|nr:ricin-type beta-trefoil lectin domain protein [Streptomyces ipomoeae]EKX62520.1 ricin-type beta-trefoil lectin domain protein [Streptomyces ipomoeae 91-03]MDX2694339.1 ricin-type beta-trefoil lectin domain protein [Streptomyces ipomoeae]MDX2819837.1 ricin-type beta-trefoil lectin domain protein [Streptomyces ipomoeae]MDX2837737.1 ricin-type beta-trefoil lectin domain protein [Streptomyces ipomoeae]MDX2872227.1 ricin-type beta-trefoil lectin domain protein [Streptomyces ipomoeae]